MNEAEGWVRFIILAAVLAVAWIGLSYDRADAIVTRAADVSIDVAQQEREQDDDDKADDIPLDGLLIALGIAALIGVAGGFIYAGIMGPRDD